MQSIESDQTKSKIQGEEFMQKHKTIMAQKLIENFENEPKLSEEEVEKNGKSNNDFNGHNNSVTNGKAHVDLPPKPLPRKSISEQGSFEENSVPKPRPRVACPILTYKVYKFSVALDFSFYATFMFLLSRSL